MRSDRGSSAPKKKEVMRQKVSRLGPGYNFNPPEKNFYRLIIIIEKE